jgi:lysophospholipase L1-like esterase
MYDQSGHNNHLTQDTAANQPPLDLDHGAPHLIFYQGFRDSPPAYWLNIPATLTADRANVSMFAVVRDVDSNVTGGLFYMGPATGPTDLGLQGFVSCFASQPVYDDKMGKVSPNDASTVGTATPAIIGLVSSPTGIIIHRDGRTGTSDPVTSKMMTVGGEYGKTAGCAGRQDMFAWIFYPAALSDADSVVVKKSLQAIYRTNSWTPKLNVALQGDSKTFGVDTPNNLTLSRELENVLPDAVIRNLGIGGHAIGGDKDKFNSPRFLEPGAANVLVLYEGTNDLAGVAVKGGDSAEAVWGYYRTFVADARANGWDRIVCCTVTPRSNGGFTPAMVAQLKLLNDMIHADKDNLFDAIANFNGITAFGPQGNPNRALLPDGLHETEAAYALEAPILAEAIKKAVAAPARPSP